ncbi:hypothetical protein Scep_026602 [Stephania cephalantha]|uniref:Uncharacterized protein n=1 Tax=Stephania cephalantha TaxID=152367 RepID=A0AAP0ER33_9MAGN
MTKSTPPLKRMLVESPSTSPPLSLRMNNEEDGVREIFFGGYNILNWTFIIAKRSEGQ